MNIKKYLFVAVLALLLFSTQGSAEEWELTFEDHPYDIGSFAEVVTGDSSIQFQDNTHQLYMYGSAFGVGNKDYNHVYIHHGFDSDIYFSFKGSASAQSRIALFFYDKYGTLLGSTNYYGTSSFGSSRIHVSNDDGIITLYQNNDVLGTASISTTNPISYFRITGYVYYSSGGYSTYKYYIDDFSTSPYCIGHKGHVKPEDSTVYFTVNTPVIDDYSYYVQMCDPNGAEIKHWDVTSFRDTCNYTPAVDLTDDGLYYLYIYGQDDKFYYSKPFLYTSAEVPADMIFKASGTLNADIRDSSNQGGEIETGGERYFYLTKDEEGHYPFTITSLEDSYSFEYHHNFVYGMHDINSSLITFEGLQNNYQVTHNGDAFPGATAATGSFTFTGNLSDGDLVNISSDCYEFDNNNVTTPGTIPVTLNASNLSISIGNLLSEIQTNGTADISANLIIKYSSSQAISLTANTIGTAGNLIALSANASNISASGPYMTGGTDSLGYTNGASTWSYNITDWTTTTEHIFEFSPDLTKPGVYGYVKDPDTQNPIRTATVTIFNDSNSHVLFTDSNGMYYKTTELEPKQKYSVKAAKSRYNSFESVMTVKDGNTTRHDIYLNPEGSGSGYYYSPHYVQFIIEGYFGIGGPYQGVNVTVYTDETRETKFGSKITDSRGVVGWEMKPDEVYYFTISSPEQGIYKEISICPGVESIIHIHAWAKGGQESQKSIYDDLNWVIYKDQISLSQGYINVSVNQTQASESETVATDITITNETNAVLYTQKFTTTPVDYSVLVPTDQNYIVYATITHPNHAPIKLQQAVTWNRGIHPNFDLGWEKQWQYSVLAAITMLLVVMLFPATTAHIGGIILCGVGMFHMFVTGWLPNDTISVIFAFLAIMLAFMFNARKQEVLR